MALRLAVGTPGADGLAATREYLHALIVAVGYVQQAVRADGQAPRPTELAAAAGASPGGHELAAGGELLDAVVGGVDDVDEALVVDGDALRRVELPRPRSTPAPRVRHRPAAGAGAGGEGQETRGAEEERERGARGDVQDAPVQDHHAALAPLAGQGYPAEPMGRRSAWDGVWPPIPAREALPPPTVCESWSAAPSKPCARAGRRRRSGREAPPPPPPRSPETR